MKSLCIIGLGLIGGSIAKDIKLRKLAELIYAFDKHANSLEKAKAAGWIDHSINEFNDIKDIKPDFIIVATPIKSAAKILLNLAQEESLSNSILTDTASAKGFIYEYLRDIKVKNIVLSHPMAGSNNSGFDASKEGLFNNKKTIIVDAFKIDSENLAIVEQFWQKLGSETIKMNVDEHDYAVAYASHLPHLIAFGLTDAIKNEANSNINESSAGGLKEFLRIAASDPDMWADILITNKEAIINSLNQFNTSIENLLKNTESVEDLKSSLYEIKKFKEDKF
ncbi:MAG: prephenate dehydrogenase [SAR86 cluster bacterium SAR86B]|uniref:Prephenate dehydrogenase n=1 Tax=SAR86 cluster bacterium SAR86B TaxID=1123867 RepID=J4X4I5_9GAMM|nr:MAG: prephenate dehydrogenase [SAR86 cluster bacterium SAR86B]